MDKHTDILILGLGNILLKDEGFGVHFTKWFASRYTIPEAIEIVDGGTLGYGLLDIVSRCRCLIVIDVIKADDEPGSIYRFTLDQMETVMPEPTSAHEVEFFHVLHMAELTGNRPEVTFLCIVPQQYGDMDLDMSSIMTDRFLDMEQLLLKELSGMNIKPEPIAHA